MAVLGGVLESLMCKAHFAPCVLAQLALRPIRGVEGNMFTG